MPTITIKTQEKSGVHLTPWEAANLGFNHVLSGLDHLAFILALRLIFYGWKVLVMALSGFTLGHGITLAMGAIGLVNLPVAPIEAMIALSIMILAREALVSNRQANLENAKWNRSTLERYPFFMSIFFGMFHGLGFAQAFRFEDAVDWISLLYFHLGIEGGQLLWIGGVYFPLKLVSSTKLTTPKVRQALAFTVGVAGGFWFFQRLVTVLGGQV
jgi:hypothetical protein